MVGVSSTAVPIQTIFRRLWSPKMVISEASVEYDRI